jgi:hypothetical protein
MKTFNRTYLPETIEYNKRVYVRNASLTVTGMFSA